jgi:hypothetical protein
MVGVQIIKGWQWMGASWGDEFDTKRKRISGRFERYKFCVYSGSIDRDIMVLKGYMK